MEEFYINLASGLVGAVLIFVIQRLYQRITEQRAPFTGTWYGAIYDDESQIVKRDVFRMKQRGDTVTGVISRTSPPDQTHRKWHFSGKIRGRQFFATFWSVTRDIPSYGCWYLTQISDDRFVGHYLSLQQTLRNDGTLIEVMKSIRCSLERERIRTDQSLGRKLDTSGEQN